MIVKMDIYGLKSSGAAFRDKIANVLYEINYRPSRTDPDVWMRPGAVVLSILGMSYAMLTT